MRLTSDRWILRCKQQKWWGS